MFSLLVDPTTTNEIIRTNARIHEYKRRESQHYQNYQSLKTRIKEDYISDDSIDSLVDSAYIDLREMACQIEERKLLEKEMDNDKRKYLYYRNLLSKDYNIKNSGKNHAEMGGKVNGSIWDTIKYIFSYLASFLMGGDLQQEPPQAEIKKGYRKQSDSTTIIQSNFALNKNQIKTKGLFEDQNEISNVSKDNRSLNNIDGGEATPMEFFYHSNGFDPMQRGLIPPTGKMPWKETEQSNNESNAHQYTPDIAFSPPDEILATIYEDSSNESLGMN